MTDITVRDEIIALLPNLRAFARSLAHDPARADDLVQDTLVKALSNLDKFRDGTNLKAWLFTILRNTFYSDGRRRWREVADSDGEHARKLASRPAQLDAMDLSDFSQALAEIGDEQREALILVAASGFSYEEAAEICGCAVGTVKSRVNRARQRLVESLGLDPESDLGDDGTMEAAVAAASV
ncbi:sigma-70 family RNA polymerase sigma factor [Futiania mangrovi]|uniref:RNA polymerase sigma factor n=1 Tax=Futiania mangrovi TaxID=2959716 RepID=A0A9J6PIG9_9PROT|nr:sigma-70 family RNA polymerase sigma factor [Futiania mangrovii]MCP1336359.1 sigma-70 family RNA polymerase sigma factor [Futiania mangrovii]